MRNKKTLWVGNAPGGNYTEVAHKAMIEVVKKHGPGAYHALIRHDDDCALLTKALPCNCDVEVEIVVDEPILLGPVLEPGDLKS